MQINKQELEQSLVIFSDGSSLGNPGPGGYGALIISSKLGEVIELGGSKQTTTNNEMELVAIVSALTYVAYNQETVHIFTDSSYVINGATSWMYGWKAKGWRKKDGEEVKNRFHWETLYSLIEDRGKDSINWHHVPGHVGIAGNERVDDIAREFAQGTDVDLYRGTKDDYPLSTILHVDIDTTAELQKSHRKARAHSYLSVIDGVVQRHRTWADTEARVKGHKAQYKKAISPEHEVEILKEWGYTPDDINE
jgi:ribonuclease HI